MNKKRVTDKAGEHVDGEIRGRRMPGRKRPGIRLEHETGGLLELLQVFSSEGRSRVD